MSMAKFTSKARTLRGKPVLAAGVVVAILGGGVAAALNAPTMRQPPPSMGVRPSPLVPRATAATPRPFIVVLPAIPSAGLEHIAPLDQLRHALDEEKLRRDLAKTKVEARDGTSGPTTMAGPALPSLPPLPSGPIPGLTAAALDTPPLPGGRTARAADGDAAPSKGGITLLEVWGTGTDVQARIQTRAGERVVRAGDAVPGGHVTSITASALVLTDAHGRTRTID